MISKNTLKQYEFEMIEEYYDYIVNSIINGQRSQAENLIKKLSNTQRNQALRYFDTKVDEYSKEARMMLTA